MTNDAPIERIIVTVAGQQVDLNPVNMRYNENNLADYMNKEYGWVDYLGKQLEHAQKEVLEAEIDADAIYSKKFLESKDLGNSDNYAKAFALAHVDVINAKKFVAERKEVVGHIKAHLRAWDRNHDNSQNRGHTLRKELDKLNRDVYSSTNEENTCSFEESLNKL